MKRMACVTALFGSLLCASTALGASPNPGEQYKQALGFLLADNRSQSDQNDALRLLRSAADSGFAPAETGLATVSDAGTLVARDVPQAVRWYTKAAQQGDWIAAFSLGRLYFLGDGVPRDTATAKKWLQQAATSGDNGSAFYLGLLNDSGQGTATNYTEAARWYKQSAEAGNPFAQQFLAKLLLQGQGVQRNTHEAYLWLLVSSAFGDREAEQPLQSMEAGLGKTEADAIRQEAVTRHDQVARTRAANECSGWPEQYSKSPSPPPLLFQSACEKVK